MMMSVKFSLSYDLLNVILLALKFVYFHEKLHCCHRHLMTLLVPAESVMSRVVITLSGDIIPLNRS